VIASSIDADRNLIPQIREVSRSLAGMGHRVARFDYRGQGQSWGQAEDLDLGVMADDVNDAVEWIRAADPIERLACLGVGLGATAVAMAHRAGGMPLAIWDPIADFQSFLHALARSKLVVEMGFIEDGGSYDGRLLADVVADDLIDDELERNGFFDAGGFSVWSALMGSARKQPRSDLMARSPTPKVFPFDHGGIVSATARWLNKCLETQGASE
jgi:pimeloyl-ACP methyl ester carboxylesterase